MGGKDRQEGEASEWPMQTRARGWVRRSSWARTPVSLGRGRLNGEGNQGQERSRVFLPGGLSFPGRGRGTGRTVQAWGGAWGRRKGVQFDG